MSEKFVPQIASETQQVFRTIRSVEDALQPIDSTTSGCRVFMPIWRPAGPCRDSLTVAARPEGAPHHRTDSSSGAEPLGHPASERSFVLLAFSSFWMKAGFMIQSQAPGFLA